MKDVSEGGNSSGGGRSMVFMLTFLSCIGGFLFGYDTGIISGALVLIDDEFTLTEIQKELVVSLTVVRKFNILCYTITFVLLPRVEYSVVLL